MLLQLEELADEVLLGETQRLQLTEDLLEDLRETNVLFQHRAARVRAGNTPFLASDRIIGLINQQRFRLRFFRVIYNNRTLPRNKLNRSVSPCQTWSCRRRPGPRRTCCPCRAARRTGSAGCWRPARSACSGSRSSPSAYRSCRGGLTRHSRGGGLVLFNQLKGKTIIQCLGQQPLAGFL